MQQEESTRQIPPAENTLIARAQQGDMAAFNELYTLYAKRVYGHIRVRAHTDEDTRQIAQETFTKVWEKMPDYNPEHNSFEAFVKFWANIMLRRYYSAQKKVAQVEQLFSEFVCRFPDHDSPPEIEQVLAHLPAYQHPSVEETVLDAEEAVRQTEVYGELLRITLKGSSPPHQLLAFGFCKLLDSGMPLQESAEQTPGKGWKPGEIVAHLSDIPLRELAKRLEQEYCQTSQLPAEQVRACFQPLHHGMECTVDEVVQDPKTRETYKNLLDHIVGDTAFRDYYTGNPGVNISHWWEAVRRRVWSEVKTQNHGPLFDLLQQETEKQSDFHTRET